MDYKEILKNELRQDNCKEDDVYVFDEPEKHDVKPPAKHGRISDENYLINHVPTHDEIIKALNKLLIDNPDQSVMLVPIRPFLQTFLKITERRLDEMISTNQWLETWIEHIRALQEVKIAETFSSGELEDNKLKWMMWVVLGEAVDISTPRTCSASDAGSILMAYGNDGQ